MHQFRLLLARRLDIAIAFGVFVMVVLGGLVPSNGSAAERPLNALGVALLLTASAALAFRRKAPITVTCVTGLCALIYYGASYSGATAAAPAVLALYTLCATGLRRSAVVLGLLLCTALSLAGKAGVVLGLTSGPNRLTIYPALVAACWAAVAGIAGEITRRRRSTLRALRESASAAECARETAQQQVLDEQRVRAVRELHDSLIHTISIINVQASVGLYLASKQPEHTEECLATIKDTSKDALNELRSALDVLPAAGERRSADGMTTEGGDPGGTKHS